MVDGCRAKLVNVVVRSTAQCFTTGTRINIGWPPLENFQSVWWSIPTKRHGQHRRFVDSNAVPHSGPTVLPRIVHAGTCTCTAQVPYGRVPVPYVPERVARCTLIAHGILMRSSLQNHAVLQDLYSPSHCQCETILLTLYSMVWDLRVSRAAPMLFH